MGAKLVSEVASKTNDIAVTGLQLRAKQSSAKESKTITVNGLLMVDSSYRRSLNSSVAVANKEAIAPCCIFSFMERIGEYISFAMEKAKMVITIGEITWWKQNLGRDAV